MGISDLQSLIETDSVLSKSGVKTVDLVKTAWTGLEAGGCAGPKISPINIGGWQIHPGKSGRNDSKGAGGGAGIIVVFIVFYRL